MILDPSIAIAGDPVHDAGHVGHGDREPALFRDFTHHRVACRLAQVDQAAGRAPALDEQHAVAMEDDRADADPRVVRVLAAHTGPASHSAVAYFASTSPAARAVSSTVRPSGLRRRPCSRSKAAASTAATSSNLGRWPSAVSSVVSLASGSRVFGKTSPRRAASIDSRTDPCWRNVLP